MALIDRFGRNIDYLRISVTDRCNLRCIYCMPEEGILPKDPSEILSFEEIERLVRIFVSLGINKVRLTGGEPLIRKNIISLVSKLSVIKGILDLSMTTNGILLSKFARQLNQAGLNRINISLDTLRKERFKSITRLGEIGEVFSGIEEALRVGLIPVKINVVMMSDFNEDEIGDFVVLSKTLPLHIRFIEFMPVGINHIGKRDFFLSMEEVKRKVLKSGEILPENGILKNGPSENYRIRGALGTIGFISAISSRFCSFCNRVRLSADGRILPCLDGSFSIDIKSALRSGSSDEAIKELIKSSILLKPESHNMCTLNSKCTYESMSQVGG